MRSAGAVSGWPASSSAHGRKPSTSPTAKRPRSGTSISAAALPSSAANRSWPTSTLASLSLTMYAISGPTRWWLIGVR